MLRRGIILFGAILALLVATPPSHAHGSGRRSNSLSTRDLDIGFSLGYHSRKERSSGSRRVYRDYDFFSRPGYVGSPRYYGYGDWQSGFGSSYSSSRDYWDPPVYSTRSGYQGYSRYYEREYEHYDAYSSRRPTHYLDCGCPCYCGYR